MSVSIFGMVTLFYSGAVIVKNINNVSLLLKKLFLISVFSSLIFDIGYIAEIRGFVVEYNYLFSVLNFMAAICVLSTRKISKSLLSPILFFFAISLVGILIAVFFNRQYKSLSFNDLWDNYFGSPSNLPLVGITFHSIFIFIRIFIFIFSFLAFASVCTPKDIKIIIELFYKVSWFVLLLSLLEMIIENTISPTLFRETLLQIFGDSDATYYVPRKTWGVYQPMVFMREPSSYAMMLFFLTTNNIARLKLKKGKQYYNALAIFCFLLLLLFSNTLSSFVYLFVIGLTFCYLFPKRFLPFVVAVSPFIIYVLFSISGERMIRVVSLWTQVNVSEPESLPKSSEIIRLYSIVNNLKLFLGNPLVGCGLGTVYSFSSVATMFANIGIMGVLGFIAAIKNITNCFFNSKYCSVFSVTIVGLAFAFSGHMGQIMYIEKIALLYLTLKFLSLSKKGKLNEI